MAEVLRQISCDPTCGFQVRSHDEREVMGITKQHAREKHNKSMADSELRSMMTTV